MSKVRAIRPIVRQFKDAYAKEAAAHVRAGGHAVVWEKGGKARLVLPLPNDDDSMCLHYWSLLDLGRNRWKKMPSGPYRGLASILVARDLHHILKRRAERDSVWPGPTRKIAFDCLECGACCKDNYVELDKDDIAKIKKAGRNDLLRAPYTRRNDGKLVLRLLKNKRCRHLAEDNKCGIYELRPSACWMFPVGSECCIHAREEAGFYDGLPPEA
jgi:Fe-S-cluster containining protein